MSDIEFHPYIEGLIKKTFANPTPPMWKMELEEARATRNKFIAGLMGPGEEVARVEEITLPMDEGEITVRLYYPSDEPDIPVLINGN